VGLLQLKDMSNSVFIKNENKYYIKLNTINEYEKSVLETEIINQDEKYIITNLKLNVIYSNEKNIIKITLIQNKNNIELFISTMINKNIKTIKISNSLLNDNPLTFSDDNALVFFLDNVKKYTKEIITLTLIDKTIKIREKTKNKIFELISQL
jgi:hypothetical protein